jgi:hypothetical protein
VNLETIPILLGTWSLHTKQFSSWPQYCLSEWPEPTHNDIDRIECIMSLHLGRVSLMGIWLFIFYGTVAGQVARHSLARTFDLTRWQILFIQEGSTLPHFYRHVAGWLNKHFPNGLAIEAYWLANKIIRLDAQGFFSPLMVLWKREFVSIPLEICLKASENVREMYPPWWLPVWIIFKSTVVWR